MAEEFQFQREKRKEVFRQNMMNMKNPDPHDEESGKRITRERRKVLIIVGCIILLVVGIVLFIVLRNLFRVYSRYDVSWSVELNSSEDAELLKFKDGVVIYGKDGASFYSSKGKILWSAPYDMKQPVIVSKTNYLVIYDQKGQTFVICDEKGKKASVSTAMPITKADISSSGVVAVVLEDNDSSYISYYRNNGAKLEVEIKTPLATQGYPLDISISPDGQKLLVSYYSISSGEGSSRIVVYDFKDGQEVPDRTVGAFDDYAETDTYIPLVQFFNNTQAAAIGDNQLDFLNLSSALDIKRSEITISDEIQKVFYGNTYLALLRHNDTDGYYIQTYTQSGQLKTSIDLKKELKVYFFQEDYMVSYDDNSCYIVDVNGRIRFEREITNGISCLIGGNAKNEYYLISMNELQKIILK